MRAAGRFVARFYWKAYRDNLTGLSAMVAYNMLLSILPLALLALFIAGQVLKSSGLESSVLSDLHRIFPTAADRTLTSALRQIQNNSGGFGIAALIASIWIGSSFWGALETAFSRIYAVDGRSWLQQKRFAVVMLVVVLLFMAATVAVPTLQSVLAQGADRLPLGLSGVPIVGLHQGDVGQGLLGGRGDRSRSPSLLPGGFLDPRREIPRDHQECRRRDHRRQREVPVQVEQCTGEQHDLKSVGQCARDAREHQRLDRIDVPGQPGQRVSELPAVEEVH